MDGQETLGVVATLERIGVDVWLDGGWGVDALLGKQTRPHDDVDIIVRLTDIPKLIARFTALGFRQIEGELPNHFVLADAQERKIDVHAVRFDALGNGIYRMETGKDWPYPADGFKGTGAILGIEVRCLTPEAQVLCHDNYEFDEDDYRDMEALHERFAVELLPHQVRPTAHEA